MTERENHNERDWEQLLDRELKSLPDREAPSTLIPRVMETIKAKEQRPWRQGTWWQWPPAAQILSLVFISALLGLVVWSGLQLSQGDLTAQLGEKLSEWLAPLGPFRTVLSSLVNAASLVLRQASGLALFVVVALCLTMYLSCVGLGTVFYRLTLRK